MGVKKRYLVICLMLLLMIIGGVAASEDASDDAVKASGDNATLTVENDIVEEDNLALDGGSDSEEIESANDTNVLGASDEKDVFAEISSSCLYTYLNAITFQDKTVYPVASLYEPELIKLIDILTPG